LSGKQKHGHSTIPYKLAFVLSPCGKAWNCSHLIQAGSIIICDRPSLDISMVDKKISLNFLDRLRQGVLAPQVACWVGFTFTERCCHRFLGF
jgi:hypothetical protein